jgi:hydrogenase maturation factor HypF (carbamoyltransferase family)
VAPILRRTRTGGSRNAVYVMEQACRHVKNVPVAAVLSVSSVMAAVMPNSAKNAGVKVLFCVGGVEAAEFIMTKLALTAKKRVVLSAHLVEEPVGDDEIRYKWI